MNRSLFRCRRWVGCAVAFSLYMALTVAAQADDAAGVKPPASADSYPTDTLANSAGGDLSLAAVRGKAATVLVSLSTECPVSNEYVATLNHLADTFRAAGVAFVAFDPAAGESLESMAEYARRSKLVFPFAKDAGGKICHRFRVEVTPEALLFDADGKLAYQGRIDDRYRAGGRGVAQQEDLRRAIEALLAGKSPASARTRPVGCPIQFDPARSQ